MQPSVLYTEDENARQTLSNGTILKWTKQVKNLYTVNADTDLSIVYTNWDDRNVLTKATKTPNNFYPTCDISAPSLGANQSGPDNVATGWTRRETGSPRVDNIFSGVVLCNGNSGSYHWGYNPLKTAPVNQTSGGDARFLLDMDINKMIFGVHFTAIDLTQIPTTEDYSANPKISHYPATVTISLKDLHDDPDKYGIVSYTWDSCYVYGPNTSDHWRTASIKPAFIMDNGDSIGGFNALTPFGSYSGVMQLSFSLPNGEVSPASGSSTLNILNHLEEKYVMGHPYEFVLKPDNTYDGIGQSAMGYYASEYGVDTAGTHRMFVDCNTIEYDDLLYVGEATSNVQQSITPAYSIRYLDLQWSWHRLIKGRTMLKYIAAFGLYFRHTQSYDPDTDSLTPDTLGDSDKIWLGEMGTNGVTTGNWITDLDSYTGPNKNGKTTNPDYTPSGGGDEGDDIDDMSVNPLFGLSSDAGFAAYFLLTSSQLSSLHTWLTDTVFPDGYDPYPYIISLVQFPLKLTPTWCLSGTSGHIKIGGEDTGVEAPVIGTEQTWRGLGTFNVPRLNGNFLDYDPYTQYDCYIPCCGWVSLPDIVAGHQIGVRINYDLTDASIIGNVYVYIDGNVLLIASKSGMMGRQTVVSGDAQGVRSAQITSSLLSAGTGALNVAAGAISGNAVAAVSGAYHIVAGLAQTNIASNSSYARQIGSTGGRALLCQYDKCYLKVTTTRAVIPDNYGHTVGYVCNKSGKVSDFSGFTVFDNVDVSNIAGATERELQIIKRTLESGVIINPPAD